MSQSVFSTRAARLQKIGKLLEIDVRPELGEVVWLNSEVYRLLSELTAAEARKGNLEGELRGASDEIEWQSKRATAAEASLSDWRQLLIEADSMLSAAGYGRVVGKEEMVTLSAKIRKAYEGRK